MKTKILRPETAVNVHGVEARAFAVVADDATGRILNQRIGAARYYRSRGRDYRIGVNLRFDDECRNGHEAFSITADILEKERGVWREYMGGCCHDAIAKHFPELAHLIPWHLTSIDGPMHYIANTLYHAGDRDHNGLRAGETRQIRNGRTGELAWIMEGQSTRYHDGAEPPTDTVTLKWAPWLRVGEGKARDLAAARHCAVWPDATDAELMQEPAALKAQLLARLPALLARFRADMEAAGFLWPTAPGKGVAALDEFTRAYIECALWSSNDNSAPEGGEPMDSNYCADDIAPAALQTMRDDCAAFREANHALLDRAGMSPLQAGHDFWLTRNGHGTGFWDRGLGEVGERLTEAAQAFGECNLYVGDDGRIYL